MVKSLIINLFAGPGAGKSTTAAGLFYELKLRGLNVELSTEFAKDLTWEQRFNALAVQPYVFGKQLMKLKRVEGQVDVVITDSPILLSCMYANGWPESFHQSVLDIFEQFNNKNFLIERRKKYNPKGRNQTESEAKEIDYEISQFLLNKQIPYHLILPQEDAVQRILELIDDKYKTI